MQYGVYHYCYIPTTQLLDTEMLSTYSIIAVFNMQQNCNYKYCLGLSHRQSSLLMVSTMCPI